MKNLELKPEYSNSRALIIGINEYEYDAPLDCAVNDAQAFADLLIERFDFLDQNVCLLTDGKATRETILKSYLSFTTSDINVNDRIIIYFAGHGYTQPSNRGEVGYLVPYDGKCADLYTLIRWDEFTRNTDLIPAKHMLFIMDACYGGLAVMRASHSGNWRFLKDMLLRPARQVLTAGKADELVSDDGGPLPNHSIFTGHLLEAFERCAESPDGIITANNVMAYVHNKVGNDKYSNQTPHYGYIDGDGDFIFNVPYSESFMGDENKDLDTLIPVILSDIEPQTQVSANLVGIVKEYLLDPKYEIKLHDLIVQQIQEVRVQLSSENLNDTSNHFTIEELNRRLEKYEYIMQDLQSIIICLAYWGNEQHHSIMQKIMARIIDELDPKDGLVIWSSLRWYPIILLLYSAGIAAIASQKYHNLASLFMMKVSSPRESSNSNELILAMGGAISDIERTKPFKQLSGYENYYAPRSEYLFKLLQPKLDDLLFLGRDYEIFFDRFEIFLAIVNADLLIQNNKKIRDPPIGRFGWKYSPTWRSSNCFTTFINEAKSEHDRWAPFAAGLFGGNYERFNKVISEYEPIIAKLNWH